MDVKAVAKAIYEYQMKDSMSLEEVENILLEAYSLEMKDKYNRHNMAGHAIKVHDHGFVRYIDHMGDDLRIVEAARISYNSPSKGREQDNKLLKYLFRNKHTSPFEMCKITFNIRMPIFVMRQYIRHRMQNVNEISARYTELADECFVPEKFRAQAVGNKQSSIESDTINQAEAIAALKGIYRMSYMTYQQLLKMGVAREMARICLPVGIYTEFYCCWDLNNLFKFFILRDDAHAQAEIQDYARAMKEITRMLFPVAMEAYDEMLQDKQYVIHLKEEKEQLRKEIDELRIGIEQRNIDEAEKDDFNGPLEGNG